MILTNSGKYRLMIAMKWSGDPLGGPALIDSSVSFLPGDKIEASFLGVTSDIEQESILAKRQLEIYEKALAFYADQENWDDDQFNPTIWLDGNIDMGACARDALAKARGEKDE